MNPSSPTQISNKRGAMGKLRKELPSNPIKQPETPSLLNDDNHQISDRIAEIFSIQEKNDAQELTDKVTIGSFLKRERESKQLSLKKISSKTKISISLLEQLENDNFESLPNQAYLKGFVRAYAQVLNQNLQLCQEILDHTYKTLGNSEQNIKKITAFDDPPQKGQTTYLPFLVVGLLALIILMPLIYILKNTITEKQTVIERPIIPVSVNSKTPLKGQEIPSAPSIPSSLPSDTTFDFIAIKPHEIKNPKTTKTNIVAIANKTPEIKTPPPVTKEILPTAKKIETKAMDKTLYTEVDEAQLEKNKEFLPDNIRHAIIPGLQNLFINANSGDSWITYKKDDEPIKKFVLKQGKTILIRGKEIRIFIGNTGVSKVFLNNKLLDLNAPTGVKSLVFPQENSHKYQIPLFIYQENGQVITSDSL